MYQPELRRQTMCCLTRANTDCERRRHRGKHGVERSRPQKSKDSSPSARENHTLFGVEASRHVARRDADVDPSRGAPAERDPTSVSRGRHLAGGKGGPVAISAPARVLCSGWRKRISVHKAIDPRGKQQKLSPMVSVWTAGPGNRVRSAPQRHLFLTASGACPRATWPLYAPAGPGRIAKSALAPVPGAEWRERMSAHKAAIRQMHCALGPAGAVRTQKVVIWPPKKNRDSGPLAPHQGRIWHPGGTPRKSGI
eukprot:gene21901-biopygen23667